MLEKSEQIVGEYSWSILSSFFLPLKSQKDAQSIRYHICSLRSQRCTWPSSQLVNEGSTLIGTQPLQLIWDLYRHLSNLLCSFPSLHNALCSSTVEQGLMMWTVEPLWLNAGSWDPAASSFQNLVEWFCSAYSPISAPYQPHISPISTLSSNLVDPH